MTGRRRVGRPTSDPLHDIANRLPRTKIKIIFDIGANVGQSTSGYLAKFPRSQIYSFEPVGKTFRRLHDHLGAYGNIHLFQLALGAATGKGEMVLKGASDQFFLANITGRPAIRKGTDLETVNLDTLDNFCRAKNITHIGYLKIDTEGGDLDVLRGASGLLDGQRIDLVEVEAGMNSRNTTHVRFETLKAFLESKDYFLFGIYEQVPEWRTREPHLRRANLVFVSQKQIDANRG